MIPYVPSFAPAVEGHKEGQVSANDLFRAIMAHADWRVAARPGEDGQPRMAVIRKPNSGRLMEIFSGDAALEAFAEGEGEDQRPSTLLRMPGFMLFGQLEDETVHRVNMDLHTPQATHFWVEQLPLLRAWAGIAAAELALYRPQTLPNPFAVLRRFDGYHVLVRHLDGERDFVMAPDEADRALAAVCTAEDTIDELVAEVEGELEGEFEIVRLDGEELFTSLAAMPLGGVVFNPLTHLAPVALAAAAIPRILD